MGYEITEVSAKDLGVDDQNLVLNGCPLIASGFLFDFWSFRLVSGRFVLILIVDRFRLEEFGFEDIFGFSNQRCFHFSIVPGILNWFGMVGFQSKLVVVLWMVLVRLKCEFEVGSSSSGERDTSQDMMEGIWTE
ncbi:hypothetical protein ZIOFF_062721 [Zingiber officinale]|uniref:Uncharacterized protein n=1 Tax=Zingiber officinale TaxID=94328 RepID=A0A8J5F5G1_ZINOF|nr:hypothetical protein ZIOFF_062721 [Zingiber officinale]